MLIVINRSFLACSATDDVQLRELIQDSVDSKPTLYDVQAKNQLYTIGLALKQIEHYIADFKAKYIKQYTEPMVSDSFSLQAHFQSSAKSLLIDYIVFAEHQSVPASETPAVGVVPDGTEDRAQSTEIDYDRCQGNNETSPERNCESHCGHHSKEHLASINVIINIYIAPFNCAAVIVSQLGRFTEF